MRYALHDGSATSVLSENDCPSGSCGQLVNEAHELVRANDAARQSPLCSGPASTDLIGSRLTPRHCFDCSNRDLELVLPTLSKSFGRQRHIYVRFYALAFDYRAAPYVPAGGWEPQHESMADRKLPPPSTWPSVRVPTILANPFSAANPPTISPALNVCSLTSMTIRCGMASAPSLRS